MILVADIGNTQTTAGVFKDEKLEHRWLLSTSPRRTSDEFQVLFQGLFQASGLAMKDIRGMAVASVVPDLDEALQDFSQTVFHQSPVMVGPGIQTGVRLQIDHPAELGADRVVNAVAAHEIYPVHLVVVDFGTATTFDVVSEKGDYQGGVIAPGLGISADALFQRAARLPRVAVKRPPGIVGRDTIASMQAGLYWGYVGLVEGILGRIKDEMPIQKVVATGGLASHLVGDLPSVDCVDGDLTLKGLRLLWEKNVRQ